MKQPKEKAGELINKFFNCIPHRHTSRKLAIKCALICCDEIIEALPKKAYIGTLTDHELMTHPKIEYWQAVKKEVIK